MKNLRQMFVLTRREQRAVIVMMIILLLVTFAERYRRGRPQLAPLTSTSVTRAPSHVAEGR